jgi:hypothetical protein
LIQFNEKAEAARTPGEFGWTLVEKPSQRAEKSIASSVKRLKSEIEGFEGVKIERNGSAQLIADHGLDTAASTIMGYHSQTRTILINERCPFWNAPKKWMNKLHEQDVFCTSRVDHVELHEIGHMRCHLADPKAYNRLRKATWPTGEDRQTARGISIKAGESPMEFVSEAYVAFRTAMQIPEELRAKLELLSKFYGGPPW